MISIWAGLAAAWLIWRLTSSSAGPLGAVLPVLYSVLTFGIISALVLTATATVQLAPAAPVVEVAASGHGAAHGQGGAHH